MKRTQVARHKSTLGGKGIKDKAVNLECPSAQVYEIRIAGHLDNGWGDWFGGLSITPKRNGDTLLTGRIVDQAALHGLLKQLRDLGLPLLSLNPVKRRRSATAQRIPTQTHLKEQTNDNH